MAGRTLKDLRQVAETLGYEGKEQVRQVLEMGGCGGEFDPTRFKEYVAVLVLRAQKFEEVLSRAEHLAEMYPIAPCPVCGAEVRHVRSLDGRFGAVLGWTCTQGGKSHFFQHQWLRLKPYFVDGKFASELSGGNGDETS